MRFKRLLTVALMALCFCAGTATAASQLNAVQITPKGNTATISLKTTGTFAHREYRPDDHLVLIDLNGVSADASLARAATPNSAVLKSYKLSTYTSAAGDEVTRLELVLGDGVNFTVADASDGLQVMLNSGEATAAAATAAPANTPANAVPVSRPAARTEARNTAPEAAEPKTMAPRTAAPATPMAAARSAAPASRTAASGAPTVIQSVSVVQGKDTLDIVIRGPREAAPFVLQNPDRLVMDFNNAVVRTPIKPISVQGRDVVAVRVGRFQNEPPVTRVVVDLKGPRSYDVAHADGAVIVHVRAHDANVASTPAQEAAGSSTVSKPAYEVAAEQPDSEMAKPSEAARIEAEKQEAAQAEAAREEAARIEAARVEAQKAEAARLETEKLKAAQAEAARIEAARLEAEKQEAARAEAARIEAARIEAARMEAARAEAAKSKATPAPPVTVAESKPVPAVVPQVPAVQDRVLAAKESEHARDGEIASATPDPGTRAGRAAEKMASTPVEMAMATPPQALPPQNTSEPAPSAKPKYTGEPISVNLKDVDLKDFFRLVHEISGLNIVLDPSVHGTVTLVLDDVPWDQALDIVLKNNGLDRELQGNVLRIAAIDTLRREAVDRRAQSEAVALAVERQSITHFLSYAKAAEVMPTVKKFLSARGDVIADVRTNALIISDIPSVMPSLQKLIQQLDRKSEEVEIEVRVVSATRSFSRDLGVQLGFSWGNGVTTIGGNNPNGTTGTTTTGGTTTTSTVPLFSNFPASGATTSFSLANITKSYGIDAVLTAAESHNLAKVLSRPRVVTQNNIKAEVKQGTKLPVYTQGTNNANASVTYIDAVLRLSVTPQITADKTIFMTVDIENTQPNGTASNGNYLLTTQQETTQVLVSDGGTVVIGGVIQTSNSVSTSQTPFLGNIPLLGNLFKERLVKTETDELIFFITPKIVQM